MANQHTKDKATADDSKPTRDDSQSSARNQAPHVTTGVDLDEVARARAASHKALKAAAKEVDEHIGEATNPAPRYDHKPALGIENPNPALRLPDLPIDVSPLDAQGLDMTASRGLDSATVDAKLTEAQQEMNDATAAANDASNASQATVDDEATDTAPRHASGKKA